MAGAYSQEPPVVMTVAGVDSGGGAGVPADLKTFAALGVHGTCALTALTAQNTREVARAEPLPPDLVAEQMRVTVADLGCQAVKTGMLATAEIVRTVAAVVKELRLPNLVVDPVMVSTSGGRLLAPGAEAAYRTLLLPMARVITPNWQEAEVLLGRPLTQVEELAEAAQDLGDLGCEAVVITGGHLEEAALDLFYERRTRRSHFLSGPHLTTGASHGSGCCFSAATAAYLARGLSVREAVRQAKDFVSEAIKYGLRLGEGPGPVNPMFGLKDQGGAQ